MLTSLLAISARRSTKTKGQDKPQQSHHDSETDTDEDEDEDEGQGQGEGEEYTLSAFGNISLSNLYFVPSTDSEISPSRRGSLRLEPGKPAFPKKRSRASSYTCQAVNHLRTLHTTPLQPSHQSEPKINFRTFVESLKLLRPRGQSTKLPAVPKANSESLRHGQTDVSSAVPSPSLLCVPSTNNCGDNTREVQFTPTTTSTDATKTGPPSTGTAETITDSSERDATPAAPFRPSGKLPRRPPLPRWDLSEPAHSKGMDSPAVVLEG